MAKDKTKELEYKIEGLKRMMKRKIRRQRKNRCKSLEKQKLRLFDQYNGYDEY